MRCHKTYIAIIKLQRWKYIHYKIFRRMLNHDIGWALTESSFQCKVLHRPKTLSIPSCSFTEEIYQEFKAGFSIYMERIYRRQCEKQNNALRYHFICQANSLERDIFNLFISSFLTKHKNSTSSLIQRMQRYKPGFIIRIKSYKSEH